jgi:large subunit ribosomal protein L13
MMGRVWLVSSLYKIFMNLHVIDAQGKVLGRLASQIAHILQGKHEASYDPRLPGADRIVVKNASRIALTGRKRATKVYYRHAGKLGHLKENKVADVLEKKPTWVLRHAVNLMLPKNRLRAVRMRRLTIEA